MAQIYFDEAITTAVELLCGAFDCDPIDVLQCFEGHFLDEESIGEICEELSYLE